MKRFFLFALVLISSENLIASKKQLSDNADSSLNLDRSVEIRYVVDHPVDDNFILVDDKKYPVFNNKENAISYVRNMSIKYDLTVVYVRSAIEKETEFTDIIE